MSEGASPDLEAAAAAMGAAPGPGAAPADGARPGDGAAAPGAPGPSGEELEAAKQAAAFVVNTLAAALDKRWPATAYTPDERAAAAAVIAPLFIKYGITPAWLERWREEAVAVVVIGGLAVTGYQRVTAARAAGATPPGGSLAGKYTETKVDAG